MERNICWNDSTKLLSMSNYKWGNGNGDFLNNKHIYGNIITIGSKKGGIVCRIM